MSCTAPIFKDDVGTIFRITIQECIADVLTPVDVSSQTSMNFYFKKPDDSVITRAPAFTTNGVDGKLQYITVIGDMDQAGVWCLQAEVILASGGPWRTSIIKFDVEEKLV